MSLFDECGGKTSNHTEDHCNSCICNQLKRLTTGRIVDIILSGEDFTNLVFTCFDSKSCCATFLDETSTFFVDCNKIEAIRLVNG